MALDLNAVKVSDAPAPKTARGRNGGKDNPLVPFVRASYEQGHYREDGRWVGADKRIDQMVSTKPGAPIKDADGKPVKNKDGSPRHEPSEAQQLVNMIRNAAAQLDVGVRCPMSDPDSKGMVYVWIVAGEKRRSRSDAETTGQSQ